MEISYYHLNHLIFLIVMLTQNVTPYLSEVIQLDMRNFHSQKTYFYNTETNFYSCDLLDLILHFLFLY